MTINQEAQLERLFIRHQIFNHRHNKPNKSPTITVMKYFFHFTYEKHDNRDRLWHTCFLTVRSQKEAEEKAERCMAEFKNPILVELRREI